MFSIYGKSRPIAKKTIDKQCFDGFSEVCVKLSESRHKPQSERQAIVDEYVNEEFESMKPKRCTQEFSTPEFCKEALLLMKEDKSNFSNLIMMKKIQKDEELTATGRKKMVWVEYAAE